MATAATQTESAHAPPPHWPQLTATKTALTIRQLNVGGRAMPPLVGQLRFDWFINVGVRRLWQTIPSCPNCAKQGETAGRQQIVGVA